MCLIYNFITRFRVCSSKGENSLKNEAVTLVKLFKISNLNYFLENHFWLLSSALIIYLLIVESKFFVLISIDFE